MLDFDEFIVWIVSSLLLGAVLSTQFKWPILSIELADFILMSAFSLVMLFIFIAGQKIAARFYDSSIKIKWLSFKQYWFQDKYRLKWAFPMWLVLPILLFLVTLSKIKWLAILNFDIDVKYSRIKRRFYNIDDVDVAKIAVSGPIACLIFGIFLKIIGLNWLAAYPVILAFLSVIPIGNGLKIFMGSRSLWFFTFILSGLMVLLINLGSVFAIVIMAILISILALVAYLVFLDK